MAVIVDVIGFRMKVGSQICKLREFWNLSQKDLAKAAGIHPSNLCRIEQGRYSVGIDVLCKILSVLHADLKLDVMNYLFNYGS